MSINPLMASSYNAFLFLSTLVLLFLLRYQYVQTKLINVLSWLINKYLLWKHPIYSMDKGRAIPTCPYRFPNGQGDAAKFLDGEENSFSWKEAHGSVYRIWNGTTPEVVITHPNDIQTIFKDSDRHSKASNNNSGYLMSSLLGQCLGLISGNSWRAVHAACSPPFTHQSTNASIPKLMHITDAHFAHLLQQEGGRLSKGRINPVEDLRILPFWIVADVLYGELSAEMKSKLERLIGVREVLFGHVIQGGLARFAISKYFPTKTNKELWDFKRRWAEFNELALAGCKNEDALGVQMYDAMKRGSLSREHMLQTLDEMLFANLDVTVGGISWNLLFLAENEKFQGEVREEIKLARQRNWVEYLASSSTLLSAGILESARLKPLAPFSVPQSAPTDRIVGGFLVPAGTNFIVDSYALNVRRSFWGDDKEQYRPWRFMGKKASEIRYQYWRFGFGPRQCLGKRTADLILRILLAHLIENYRVGLDEKSRWDKNPTTWITHPNTDIMCKQIASVG